MNKFHFILLGESQKDPSINSCEYQEFNQTTYISFKAPILSYLTTLTINNASLQFNQDTERLIWPYPSVGKINADSTVWIWKYLYLFIHHGCFSGFSQSNLCPPGCTQMIGLAHRHIGKQSFPFVSASTNRTWLDVCTDGHLPVGTCPSKNILQRQALQPCH